MRIPFTLVGGASAVRGIQLDILYDTAVLEVPHPAAACKLRVRGSHGSVYTAAPTDPSPPAGKGRLRILALDLNGKSFDDGDLLICHFRVLPTAPPGVYEVGFDKAVLAGPDAEVLEATLIEAHVEVLSTCAAPIEAE